MSRLTAMTAFATDLNLRVALKRFISFRLTLRLRPDSTLGEARICRARGTWCGRGRCVGETGEGEARI